MSDRPHFPDLDGLRAFAAFAVVFYHSALWLAFPDALWADRLRHVLSFGGTGGPLGVTFFFVLSGFLITYLMLAERQRTGHFRIGRFYMRRILRIWPLYYATLIVGALVCHEPLAMDQGLHGASPSFPLYAAFLANFDHIRHGEPACGIMGVQWSVCVEEQFYLLWPVFFLVFGRRRLLPLAILALGAFAVWYTFHDPEPLVRYYHLIPNMRYLACGGLLACLVHRWPDVISACLRSIPTWGHSVIYLVWLAALFFGSALPFGALRTVLLSHGPMLFFTYVLAHQTLGTVGWLHVRHLPWIGHLGRISYGLYLIHMIPIFLISRMVTSPDSFWYTVPLAMLCTVLLSEFSYRYLESPFLRLKSRFG
ncbi:MAG: acyltransferase [Flavobacteriales bacterium]|nr:acyltransferase [Flavobacteriales bacterium]